MAVALVFLPAVAFLVLLGWGLGNAQGRSFGGFAVNASFGDAPILNPTPASFTLKLLDGRQVSLEGYRGRALMVDFWASWCPPCRQEAPTLARLSSEYQGKGVDFLGIALWDSEEEARKFLERYRVMYANGIDQRGGIAIDFGVTGIPEKYFISPQGRVVRRFLGPAPEERLRAALDELLAAAP